MQRLLPAVGLCTLLLGSCATSQLPPAIPEEIDAGTGHIDAESLTVPVPGVIEVPPAILELQPQMPPYPRAKPPPKSQTSARGVPVVFAPLAGVPPPRVLSRRADNTTLQQRPRFIRPTGKALTTGLVRYTWEEGNTYLVSAAPDHPVTVTLPPGEKLAAKVSVDPEKWDVGYIKMSEATPPIEAIQLRPTGAGYTASTQLITTSGHLYLVKLQSQEAMSMLSVQFSLPDEDEDLGPPERAPVEGGMPFPTLDRRRLHTSYTLDVTRGTPPWGLLRVFDDGHLTVLEFKESLQFTGAPSVAAKRPTGEPGVVEWATWEQKNGPSYYIVGGLWPVLVLQGQGAEITITRGANRHATRH